MFACEMSAKRPTVYSRLLRPVLASLIVLWLASRLDWATLPASLQQIDPGWLVLGLVAMVLEALARCANWYQVLRTIGIRLPSYVQLVQKYFVASFAGSLIPSSLGTDALRTLFSRQLAGGRVSKHAFAVVATNLLTLAGGLLLVFVTFLWLAGERQPQFLPLALAGLAVFAVLLLLLSFLALPLRAKARVAHCLPASRSLRRRAVRLLARLGRDLRRLRAGAPAIGIGVLFALAMQCAAYAIVGLAAGIDLPAPAWLMLPTVVALVGMLPASFLGFGATQAAVAGILVLFDNPGAPSIVAATTISLLALTVKVLGGLVAIATEPAPVEPDSPR